MMMPANFSAVSENEMTYVIGGSIADYLAPAMDKDQWRNFSKNMITIVGNNYVSDFVGATVGKLFSGNWKLGDGVNAFGQQNWTIWSNTGASAEDATATDKVYGVVNIALNVLGNAAAIYNLGFGNVKNSVGESQFIDFKRA